MKQGRLERNPITRRTLIAGAAAGTVTLATGDASAQRCPATPPARTKGPAIWLDYDQHDMDEMYDQSVYAFNQQHTLARSDANNRIATAIIGKSERFAYGTCGGPDGRVRPSLSISMAAAGAAAAPPISRFMPSHTSMPARISFQSTSPM